jgi:hypothetical protein
MIFKGVARYDIYLGQAKVLLCKFIAELNSRYIRPAVRVSLKRHLQISIL